MYEVKWIRDNPGAFDAGLARRGMAAQSSTVLDLDARRRAAQELWDVVGGRHRGDREYNRDGRGRLVRRLLCGRLSGRSERSRRVAKHTVVWAVPPTVSKQEGRGCQ